VKIELPVELDHRGIILLEDFDSEGYTLEVHTDRTKKRNSEQVHLRVIKDGKEKARAVKTFTRSEMRGYRWASILLHEAQNKLRYDGGAR